MVALGGEIVASSSIVRDTVADAQGVAGYGLLVFNHPDGTRARAQVRESILERNEARGIHVVGGDVDLWGVTVRDTRLVPNDTLALGGAVHVELDALGQRATASVAWSVLVRDVSPRASDGELGHCIVAQLGSTLDVLSPRVEGCTTCGIAFDDASGSVVSTTVRDVRASASARFGDGLLVSVREVHVRDVIVENTARAALAVFGARVTVEDSTFLCPLIDFNSEAWNGKTSTLEDLGGNRCGCPEPDRTGKAASAGLEPPAPPEFQ